MILRILFLCLFLTFLPVSAQTLELSIKNDLAISTGGTHLFSVNSNNILKSVFPADTKVNLQISSFSGSPFVVAPTSDFTVIGPLQEIRGLGNYIVDYANAASNTNSYGLSITPSFGFSIFSLTPTAGGFSGGSSSTSSSSSSSSSGGISSSSTSSSGSTSTSSSGGVKGTFNEGSIDLEGPGVLNLQSNKNNFVKLTVSQDDFLANSRCQIYTSNDPLLRIKPRIFDLGSSKKTQIFFVLVPREYAVKLIETDTNRTITIVVACENGARDEVDLIISP